MSQKIYDVNNGLIQLEEGLFSRVYQLNNKELQVASDEGQTDRYAAYEAFLNSFEPGVGLQVAIDNTDNTKEKFIVVTTPASSTEAAVWKFTRLDLEVGAAIRRIDGRETKPLTDTEIQEVLTAICPVSGCAFHRDYLQMKNKYASCLIVENLSDITNEYFLNPFTDLEFDSLISIHDRTLTPQEAVKIIRKKYLKNNSAHQSEPDRDCNRFTNQKLIAVTVTIVVFGDTREKLTKNVEDVQEICRRHRLSAKKLIFQQKVGLHTSLPIGKNYLKENTVMESHTAAMFHPLLIRN